MSTQPHTRRNPYKDYDAEEKRGRYYGAYQGFVRDRDDPDRLGRVKVHIQIGRASCRERVSSPV